MSSSQGELTREELSHELQSLEHSLDKIPDAETNIFSILGIYSRETRLTRFLQWLLDPQASHGMGRKFLNAFLEECGYEIQGDICVSALVPIQMGEEEDDAEVDLIIRDSDSVIGVEIKTTHQGKGRQLEKEHKALARKFPEYFSTELVYLTYAGKDRPGTDHPQIFWHELLDRFGGIVQDVPGLYEKILIENFIQTITKHVMKQLTSISPQTELYIEHEDAIEEVTSSYEQDRRRAYRALSSSFFSVADIDETEWEESNSSTRFIKFYKQEWKDVGEGVNIEFEPHIHLTEGNIRLRLDVEHGNKDEIRAEIKSQLSDEVIEQIEDRGWVFTDGSYSFIAKSLQFDLDNPQDTIDRTAREIHELRRMVEPVIDIVASAFD